MRRSILFSATFALLTCAAEPARAAAPDVQPGLSALRLGRFEQARISFAQITAADPTAPEGPFFEAFQLWWRLIDHPDDAALRVAMEERLNEAARRGRLMLASQDRVEDERALVFQGVSQLLIAQSRSVRGSLFSAASMVRQGHKALTEAVRLRPDGADALFAMGAYNYYADRLPLFVKGLSFLLVIPRGDSAKGIAQLEKAAESSPLFDIESFMLLAHIFSGGFEEDYGRALGYVEKAASRCPGSPLISLARADLLFKMGRLRESSDLTVASLATVSESQGYALELQRALDYRASACMLKLNDPLGAMERIEHSLERSMPESPADKKRWVVLWADAARDAGRQERLEYWIDRLGISENVAGGLRRRARLGTVDRVATARAEALRALASGETERARLVIETLLDRSPQDLRLRYDIGRILQQQGRLEEARPYLQAVVDAPRSSVSGELAGWAMLRLGWQLEQEGRRADALALYHRAAEVKQFTFQPAALDRISRPGAPQPEG